MKKWKLVYWFVLALFAVELLSLPFKESLSLSNAIGLIISGISLFPFYGFAYQTPIGSKSIAVIIFSFNSLGTGAAILFSIQFILATPTMGAFIGAAVGSFVLIVLIYPQFMYAFKSDHLWSRNA